jgi:hypothetical protein
VALWLCVSLIAVGVHIWRTWEERVKCPAGLRVSETWSDGAWCVDGDRSVPATLAPHHLLRPRGSAVATGVIIVATLVAAIFVVARIRRLPALRAASYVVLAAGLSAVVLAVGLYAGNSPHNRWWPFIFAS